MGLREVRIGLRDLAYRAYERRLEASLAGDPIPRHVGVILDGNRRWARLAGFTDVSNGHQKGADHIFELLGWCSQARVEVVTLWLLATDNLSRPAAELDPLLKIIESTVRALADGGWHVKPVGALDLLPAETAQVLMTRERPPRAALGCWSTWPSGTAGGGRSPTVRPRCKTMRSGTTIEELPRCSMGAHRGAPLHRGAA
jgi:short-chain Z-isoprenyl diphosphate synthase